MVVEKLIPKKALYMTPDFVYEHGTLGYRISNDTRLFRSTHEYWYDGRLFLVGTFGDGIRLMDFETWAMCVCADEFKTNNPNPQMLIERFKFKLEKVNKSIDHLVSAFKRRNLDLETWKINMLIT